MSAPASRSRARAVRSSATIRLPLLLAALGTALAPGPADAQSAWLPRVEPVPRAVVAPGQQRLVVDSGVPEDVARRVFDRLDREHARGTESITVYRVPGDRLLLATAFSRVARDNAGLRLFLVDTAGGGAVVVDRGRDGAADAYDVRPVFFPAGAGRTLVLVGVNAGRPRGAWAYEVAGGRLRRVGTLRAIATGVDPRDPPRDPVSVASVTVDRDGWLIGLAADALVQTDPRRPPQAYRRVTLASPLLFRLRGDRFEPVSAP